MKPHPDSADCRCLPVRSLSVLAVIGWALSNPHFAVAQTIPRAEQSTGAIAGRVKHVVTGQYLTNARISVQGTNLTTFTDESGSYRLAHVPSGPVVVEVFYTGLDAQRVTLNLSPGQRVEQDIALTSAERYGQVTDAVKIDPFVVSTSRVREGEALAINEQRFAPNIKNVVTTDAFGDVSGGNVAEYLNFLPGVNTLVNDQTGFVGNRGAGIRGFDSDMVGVTVDGGGSMANANQVTRQVSFEWTSISNYSRIEVTKAPTPATPADSMGGSINMVSKSAFEREKAEFRYRVAFTGNERYLRLSKSPFSRGKATPTIRPTFDFDYTLPVSENFGIVVTGLVFSDYTNLINVASTYRPSATGVAATPVSPGAPRLLTVNVSESPRIEKRQSFSAKADWRPRPNLVLSLRGEATEYESDRSTMTFLNATVGANASPVIVGRQNASHGPDFSRGAQGRGTLEIFPSDLVTPGDARSVNGTFRFDNGTWRIDGGLDLSESTSDRNAARENTFQTIRTQLVQQPNVRVNFENIGIKDPGLPGTVRAFDNNDQEIDLLNPANYRILTGQLSDEEVLDRRKAARVNIRRTLDLFAFPLAVQTGATQAINLRDRFSYAWTYTYNGMGGDLSIKPFLSEIHADYKSAHFGSVIPVVDQGRAYAAWLANPGLFTMTPAQAVAREASRINSSWVLEETLQTYYGQLEMSLMQNRLRILGGVRYEKTSYDGGGLVFQPEAVWQRNADGSFVRNAAGQRIRKPEAGAVGSMEELRLIRQERGHHVDRTFDGFYPSVHFTYNISKNFQARAAYAKTYGRPNFNNIVPNTTVNEDDNEVTGRISTRNIALKPWGADNYDLALEYYTERGGIITAGLFRKEVVDFFGSLEKQATAEDLERLGLSSEYVGFDLITTTNAGNATLNGFEIEARHSLDRLGRWGRFFNVFANVTKVQLEADEQRTANFTNFRPLTINWGVFFTRKPFTLQARWNHRGDERKNSQEAIAPGAFFYEEARTTLDANFTYEFHRRLSFFASARNLLNTRHVRTGYAAATPDYARPSRIADSGAQFTLGFRGSY